MSIYDVFSGGNKPYDKDNGRHRNRQNERKPMS